MDSSRGDAIHRDHLSKTCSHGCAVNLGNGLEQAIQGGRVTIALLGDTNNAF